MAAACGVDYAEASRDAVTMVFGGVECDDIQQHTSAVAHVGAPIT